MSSVGEILGILNGSTVMSVVVFLVVDGVSDDFVGRGVSLVQEFLESDDGCQNQSELADDQGFKGEESETAEGERDESGGFQLEEEEKRKKHFQFLLFASGCK